MTETPGGSEVVDSLILRFVGKDDDGTQLHELRAAHVAEVLQGIVGLTSDFAKAGVFDSEGPISSEVLVRPAREGSFIMEVVREIVTDPSGTAKMVGAGAGAAGAPSISKVIWWATRSARADVADIEHLDNGNVKLKWQDNTADEVPKAAWEELNKRKRRRKKHLRQIMAPLSDPRVSAVEVSDEEATAELAEGVEPDYTLVRSDYDAMRPQDEIEEVSKVFDVEAQMSAIDFDNAQKWRVRTKDQNRLATVEDDEFLGRVAGGLPIRRTDIFRLRIREDVTTKNGRNQTKWTVLKVENHRRAAHDDDS